MTQEDKTTPARMEVHKTVYAIDAHGNTHSYDVTEHCYFDEWADFDD